MESVLKPLLSDRVDYFKVWQYSERTKKKTRNFLKSIKSMGGFCFLLRDLDDEPCFLKRIQQVKKRYCPTWDCCNFVIVIRGIEGWYLSGLQTCDCHSVKTGWRPARTEGVTKGQFNSAVPGDMTRYEFMRFILNRYDLQQGVGFNESLQYLFSKLQSAGLL